MYPLSMFQRYTENARKAIFYARYEASMFGSTEITAEHLLLGVFKADRPLLSLQLPAGAQEEIRKKIERRSPPRPPVPTNIDLPLSKEAERVLKNTLYEAEHMGHAEIGVEHLLLGMLSEEEPPLFVTALLRECGLKYLDFQQKLVKKPRSWPRSEVPRPYQDIPPGQGARWGAGYVRKTSGELGNFFWEKRRCEPRDALVHRESKRIWLYTGQSYDSSKFDFIQGGWMGYHCVVCWRELIDDWHSSFAYTNGQDWLCAECYRQFIERESE